MIPVIKSGMGRQPVTSAATTGLSATRNPSTPGAPHVTGNNVRQKGQIATGRPGKLRG
jgi:hypothetical protein